MKKHTCNSISRAGVGNWVWRCCHTLGAALALTLAAPANLSGVTVVSHASNTAVYLGLPAVQLEFENPLTGTEKVMGHPVLNWRDADYAAGPPRWYDDWIVSTPAEIDGTATEIWLRRAGHSASTTTTVPSAVVSIHLTGDQNDGLAQVMVDGVEVARLNLYSASPETALVVVRGLALTTHTLQVNALGDPAGGALDDVHIFGAAALGATDVKWYQPPQPTQGDVPYYYGWNEPSFVPGPQIAADDWVCTTTNPVTHIRWWGSLKNWRQPDLPPALAPSAFQITFWTDVPVSPNNLFSHPGTAIWQVNCTTFTWQFVGWDYDPRTQTYEACFLFDQTLNPEEWFYQQGTATKPNIFWMSIAAIYPLGGSEYPWGWKTRPREPNSPAPDAAVRIFDPTLPTIGAQFKAGEPIWWPDPSVTWDLAFELISSREVAISKWTQVPDLTTNGIDVNASYLLEAPVMPYVLADDFQCTATGPITDLSIWGSWWHDHIPGSPSNVSITLSIHRDIPAMPPGYSMPGELLWMRTFEPGQFRVTEVSGPVQLIEGWLNPPSEYEFPGDRNCFRYDFHVPEAEAFLQEGNPERPVVYWLDLQARLPYGPEIMFGWKTCPTNWNDDAVWAHGLEPYQGPWNELRYPRGHPNSGKSLDLAFRIATAQPISEIKWSQPPQPYQPPNLFNGWNEPSLDGGQQIVADDWVCTNGNPVTDIHWWGSYVGWGEPLPPNLPDAFRITIWTDVPAGASGIPFSHPGKAVWQILCENFTWQFVGWDIDPRSPLAPPEACFRFDQDLLEREWFWQEPGTRTNIYWISIAAVYLDITPDLYPWGWKMRPRDLASPAPDDAVRIYMPTRPVVGDAFLEGVPIEWPEQVSWDAAFVLTTVDVGPQTDWGDAPDKPYPTLAINNGANHTIVKGYQLGAQLDGELNGQPNASATGDDLANVDDEDGVTFNSPLTPGQVATVSVVASGQGLLNAWLDFAADGSWAQAGDQIFANVNLAAGTNHLSFLVPASATANTNTFARFRFSTMPNLSFVGAAPNGEVEDYRVVIEEEPMAEADLGDAPDSSNSFGVAMSAYPPGGPGGVMANYPTVYRIGSPPFGPIHRNPWALAYLGLGVSGEVEADLGADMDGVNNIQPPANIPNQDGRDDGLLGPIYLPHCGPGMFRYVVTVMSPSTAPLYLNAWFDWNRDGDWNDTLPGCIDPGVPEWAVQNRAIHLANLPGPFPMRLTNTVYFPAWQPQTNAGPLWLRLTLAEQQWPPVAGTLPIGGEGPALGYAVGETEDYFLTAYQTEVLDFGDAPDGPYPTVLANNGARHVIVTPAGAAPLRLGQAIDPEPDGQPNALATGDDLSAAADEDGVFFLSLLVPGQPAQISVVASGNGLLNAWLDFNADGSWATAGDQIFANTPLAAGTNTLTFQVPPTATGGTNTFARFRFSTTTNLLSFVGQAPDGEVEDYQVPIQTIPPREADLGDAPDSSNTWGVPMTAYPIGGPAGVPAHFPTVYQIGSPPFGPIHVNPFIAFLGQGVSGETEADLGFDMDPTTNLIPPQDQPDLDRLDDGVQFPLVLPHCTPTSFRYLVTLAGPPPQPQLFVNVWFDWNRDGDWNDQLHCPNGQTVAPEWAVQNQLVLVPGPGSFGFFTPQFIAWHPSGSRQPIWMRITLSEQPWPPVVGAQAIGGEGPAQGYVFGETEDYYIRDFETEALDFGDAPERPYPTLRASNGARHVIVPGLFLGQSIDHELDGQPDPAALGDDNNHLADEDGVVIGALVQGQMATVQVTASAPGLLSAWVDFGADGSWAQAGDQILANVPLVAGTTNLTFPVPPNAAVNTNTFARFRFSTAANLSFVGQAPDGEVEDYQVRLEEMPMREADLGDAPDQSNTWGVPMTAYPSGGPPGVPANYPTVFQAGSPPFGPIHRQPFAVAFLGVRVSGESEADFGPDQDPANNLNPPGDTPDLDRFDDSLMQPIMLPGCVPTSFRYVVTATAPMAAPLYVNVWFDWNRDGDWNDTPYCTTSQPAPEWAVRNQPVPIPGPGVFTMNTPYFMPWHPSTNQQPIWMRISLAEMPWPTNGFSGAGGDGPPVGYMFGETEDFYLTDFVMQVVDFGDAPDQPYPTLLANNGARHRIHPAIYLGKLTDYESDGQPDPNALGDDNAAFADEDGVVFLNQLRPGVMGAVAVYASTSGVLNAWIDFNADGSWSQSGDQIFLDQAVTAGSNYLTFPVPLNIAAGSSTFARFRFSSIGGLPYTGGAPDGEVEDYQVQLQGWPERPDLGDAPDSSNTVGPRMTAYPAGGPAGVIAQFPTVFLAGSPPFGPYHISAGSIAHLGIGVSREFEADVGADADGVNNIVPQNDQPDLDGFDDGVPGTLFLPHCRDIQFPYLLNVTTPSPQTFFLNVWFDWNRDGDWNDVPQCPDGAPAFEWAVQNHPVSVLGQGLQTMMTPPFRAWHPTADKLPIWMRITLSERPWAPITGTGGEGPPGGYAFGETEDYYLKEYEVAGELDFGDARDPRYPTLLVNNGARHYLVPGFHLGSLIDFEPDGQPSTNALGDDLLNLPDEDGVVFATPLLLSSQACVNVTLTAGPAGGLLDGWIDFNRNGTWEGAEKVFNALPLVPGANPSLCFSVPTNATLGPTFARFRLSTVGGLPPTGVFRDGEVEDYFVTLAQTRPFTNIVITNIVVTNLVVSGVTNQHATIEWNAENGVHYQVQATTNLLNAPNLYWFNVGPEVIGPTHTMFETNSLSWFERYYRVMAPFSWP